MRAPRFTQIVANLPHSMPFTGAEAHERASGRPFRARIGANENPFGPTPKAVAAMRTAAQEAWMYGDSESHVLRQALSARLGVEVENIVVGEGIDALLGTLTRLVLEPGDAVVTSNGAYPTFNFHVAGCGGVLHKTDYRDDHEDLQALVEQAEATRAKLLYLSNPDNPMGSRHSGAAIREMIEDLPEGTLLVLDEAYIEFAPAGTAPEFAPQDPRVIRLRTFSKAHAMAGARIGYAIGAPELITAFDKLRNHFGVNRIAQTGALASLHDREGLAEIIRQVAKARNRIGQIAVQNGISALPSAASFVAVDCGADGDFARAVLAELKARDIFVRMPAVAPLDRCIRISTGLPHELDVLEQTLPQALAAARRG